MLRVTVLFVFVFLIAASVSSAADCNNGGRYEVNKVINGNDVLESDGTVTDCRTGLVWLKDANCLHNLGLAGIDKASGVLSWNDAMRWVGALRHNYCGLRDGSIEGDWRLPTRTEWMAMVGSAKFRYYPAISNGAGTGQWTEGDIFDNIQPSSYWSITDAGLLFDFLSMTYVSTAWFTNLGAGGGTLMQMEKSLPAYVWPVRAGQSGTFGTLYIQ